MLNWIKKRCRRKSAPSAGSGKEKAVPVLYGLQRGSDPVDHDYEEIDDVQIPDQLAYAIVDLKDKINSEPEVEDICPVCRRRQIKGDLVCFCSVLNSNQISDDEYEFPDNLEAVKCSTPIDNKTKSKKRQPDFSKRPLPEIPNENKTKTKSGFEPKRLPEWSCSDDSNSSSSGYFDSLVSNTDSSSDDSLSFEFQRMVIRQRSREVMNRQRSQPTVRHHSPPRPRMGCRALSRNQNMRRCRSTSRACVGRFTAITDPWVKQQIRVYENLPPFNNGQKSAFKNTSSSRLPNYNIRNQRQIFRSYRSHVKLYENV